MADMTGGGLLYDEQGRPYFLMPDGHRNYVSPAAFDPKAAPVDNTGIFRSDPTWNTKTAQYDTPIDGGNILSLGLGGLLGAGAASAFGGFGGAAASAGSAQSGMGGMTGTAAATHGAGMAGMAGDTVGGAASGIGSKLLNTGVNLGVAGLGKALGGGGPQIPPELQQMLDLQKQRMQFQNPLFEAISRLAMSRLPTAQQQPMPGSADPMAQALQRLAGQGQG